MADQDIRDFLTALSAAGVRHVVVGAYALAAHGHVRATGDIDVLVEPTPTNAHRLAAAVRDFAGTSTP
jgi:predicted nucleotidyltransferase